MRIAYFHQRGIKPIKVDDGDVLMQFPMEESDLVVDIVKGLMKLIDDPEELQQILFYIESSNGGTVQ